MPQRWLLLGQRGHLLLRVPGRLPRPQVRGGHQRVRQQPLQERCQLHRLRQQLHLHLPLRLQWHPLREQHSRLHREVLPRARGSPRCPRVPYEPCGSVGGFGAGVTSPSGAGSRGCGVCVPSSCFNGGTCVDGINTFTCLCPAGFTGSYCEHNINECDSKPCLNGGTCQDSYGTYKCTCPQGYTGLNCQVEEAWAVMGTTHGSVSPCQPGGFRGSLLWVQGWVCVP